MARRLPAALLLALTACVGPAGCGVGGLDGDGQDRPVLVASFPSQGGTTETGFSTVLLTFDEPVTLFLPYQVVVLRDGVQVGVRVFQAPGEAASLRLTPLFGQAFTPGAYEVRVLEGLVLNAERHYALEPVSLTFQVAGTPAFFVGSPSTDRVTFYDDATLAPLSSTPTPGGRDPVALLGQRQGTAVRVFVQLADGGGAGAALAHFLEGAAAMVPVTLTTSGGDLSATAGALTLDQDGVHVYAAYRDVLTQQVRVARVRAADGVETGSVLLSIPAAADTAPTALTLRVDNTTLLVTARSGGAGYVAYVNVTDMLEIDRDPGTAGVQAAALGGAAGPADLRGSTLLVAPESALTADLRVFTLDADTATDQVSAQVGTPTALRVTFDGSLVLEGIAAGPVNEPLVTRLATDLATATPVDVTDDVGGLDQGTTRVRNLGQVPAQQRFYVLLDADCLARFAWDGAALTQDDLDPGTSGIQVLKLVGTAAGATTVGTVVGSVP